MATLGIIRLTQEKELPWNIKVEVRPNYDLLSTEIAIYGADDEKQLYDYLVDLEKHIQYMRFHYWDDKIRIRG